MNTPPPESSGTPSERGWPEDRPTLLAFAPLIYTAWSDGVLSPAEMGALRAHVDAQAWLPREDAESLGRWLDAGDPPSATELADLGARIRSDAVAEDGAATRSLADLGLALARASGSDEGAWGDPAAVDGLRALERALGVAGREAALRVAAGARRVDMAHRAPPYEPGSLRAYLDRDHGELRAELLGQLVAPPLAIERGLDLAGYRAAVLEAVRHLAARGYGALGYPVELGGRGDAAGALAAFETLAFGDLSVVVKFGVQFGLFGGSVLQLGTERHHEAWLEKIGSGELLGCYAMTETGHGSNVRDLETTATYDPDTDELVVHTPSPSATKDYIGNAALHGRMATVFARLVVSGHDHGVHAVLVPIRDPGGRTLPGVHIEDRGAKEGLDGVDNGRIAFEHVRVPRGNLLDRFGSIGDDGRYASPIPSPGRRFFTMLGTLVAGRISIAAASVSAAKRGLTIALRRTDARRQFGPEGAAEVPVLDYLALQRELLPRLATTFGLHFAVRALQRRYAESGTDERAEVEVEAAGLKAYASAHCVETLQACREACGGEGFMAASGLAALKDDTDVFTTFEGANLVLLQLVSKGLLSRFRKEMGDLRLWDAVRYLAERAETTLTELNPIVTRTTDVDHLMDPDFHRAAMVYREERLLRSVARRLRSRIDAGVDTFAAMNECQDHLVELARAHVERTVLERMQAAVAESPSPGLSETLGTLAALYALSRIEAGRGWFLEVGYVEPPKSRAIRSQVNALCREVREGVRFLVDAFGVPDELLPEIATADRA